MQAPATCKEKKKAISYLNSSSPLSSPQPTPKTSDEMQSKFKYSHMWKKTLPLFDWRPSFSSKIKLSHSLEISSEEI